MLKDTGEIDDDGWLVFNYKCNKPIELLDFGGHTKVEFGSHFNQSIDNLPSYIRCIKFPFDSRFNMPINKLPETLQYLRLRHMFDQPIYNYPSSLKILGLSSCYDHPLDNLPPNLQILIIGEDVGCSFTHPINNIPDSVRLIEFMSKYNTKIDKLPKNLECLLLSFNYNHPLPNLPEKLKSLSIGHEFTQELKISKFVLGLEYNINKYNNNIPFYYLQYIHNYGETPIKEIATRVEINKYNVNIRMTKLIDLLIKIE